jgi:hypothetical protein
MIVPLYIFLLLLYRILGLFSTSGFSSAALRSASCQYAAKRAFVETRPYKLLNRQEALLTAALLKPLVEKRSYPFMQAVISRVVSIWTNRRKNKLKTNV